MKKAIISFDSLGIDPCIFFLGTDADIAQAEEKEAGRAAELETIIFSDSFRALELTRETGAREILHHSTRPGVAFQLSYIAADGIPTMHENYIRTSEVSTDGASVEDKSALLRHYVNATLRKSRELILLTA